MLDRLGDAIGSRVALLAELAERTPLRRLVAPEDVADVIVFLASSRARMITGAAVPIDGGILAYGEPPTMVAAEMIRHRAGSAP
jgi:NAD(P)-dependent dehydrogenase (short-subunit alcohol dehydrogenase family)